MSNATVNNDEFNFSLEVSEEEFLGQVLPVYISVFLVFVLFSSIIKHCIIIVQQAEVVLVERCGKYRTTLMPGWHLLIPYIDSPRMINWRYMDVTNNNSSAIIRSFKTSRVCMREHCLDFGLQHVITQDTVEMHIDALVYFRITDPRLAVFAVDNLPDAIELLVQATLRNIVASMTLDDTFSSREVINAKLLSKVVEDAERWGVDIIRVEIFDIQPARDIKKAMESQVTAERMRRAMVLKADGTRQSQIIRSRGDAARIVYDAVGDAQSFINDAAGKSEARTLTASAEAAEVSLIKDNLTKDERAVDYITALQWLRTLKQLCTQSKENTVIMLPVETIDGINAVMRRSPARAMTEHVAPVLGSIG